MDNILRDEVNQHTSDEVTKVLAELEAQGVDLTAIKEALAGGSGMKVKSVQKGFVPYGKNDKYLTSPQVGSGARTFYKDITIQSVVPDKSVVLFEHLSDHGYAYAFNSATSLRLYLGDGSVSTNAIYNDAFTYFIVEFE